MAGGVQDVLLDEAAVKDLAVEDLVVALGRDVDEPVDDAQRAGLVVIPAGADAPDGDVVAPHPVDGCLVALFDRREQAVGHVDDGLGGSGHGSGSYSPSYSRSYPGWATASRWRTRVRRQAVTSPEFSS